MKSFKLAILGLATVSAVSFISADAKAENIFLNLKNRLQGITGQQDDNVQRPIFIQPNQNRENNGTRRAPQYDVINQNSIRNNRGQAQIPSNGNHYNPAEAARQAIAERNEYRRRREASNMEAITLAKLPEQFKKRFGKNAKLSDMVDSSAFDAAYKRKNQQVNDFVAQSIASQESAAERAQKNAQEISRAAIAANTQQNTTRVPNSNTPNNIPEDIQRRLEDYYDRRDRNEL